MDQRNYKTQKGSDVQYVFKPGPEFVWVLIVTVVTAVTQMVQGAPPSDWATWLVAVVAGIIRAILGVVLAMLPSSSDPTTP